MGWDYAIDHPEELIDHDPDPAGWPKGESSGTDLRFEAEQMRNLVMAGLVDVGHMNPGRFQRIAETSQKLGLLKTVRDPEDFLFQPPRPLAAIWLRRAALAIALSVLLGLLALSIRQLNGLSGPGPRA